jgi:hypothetical protein
MCLIAWQCLLAYCLRIRRAFVCVNVTLSLLSILNMDVSVASVRY